MTDHLCTNLGLGGQENELECLLFLHEQPRKFSPEVGQTRLKVAS